MSTRERLPGTGVAVDEISRCPACFGLLEVSAGSMSCQSCGRGFPILSGVPLLVTVDRSWRPMIAETIAKAEILRQTGVGGHVETDRRERADAYHEVTADLMDRLFEDAFSDLGIGRGSMVLDVGAANLSTARRLAEKGASVVATDVFIPDLLQGALTGGSLAGPGRLKSLEPGEVVPVMADASRLPFADGVFDLTYCRSTIHHLDSPRHAIREMARVTRPGGRVVLTSEPIRSILDRRQDYLDGIFDYEERLNERVLPVTTYTIPMRRHCRDVSVTCYLPGVLGRGQKVLRALRVSHAAHFAEGERLDFRHSFKLLFSGASANITGTRMRRVVPRPRPVSTDGIIARPEELYLRTPREEERLRALYRTLLNRRRFASSAEMGEVDCGPPHKGWRAAQNETGLGFRYTCGTATYYLRNDRSAENVMVRVLAFPPEAGPATGSIVVNGENGTRFRLTEWDSGLRCAKPARCGEILEVRIENDSTFIPDEVLGNGDVRELGVGVVRIWQE
ncbi:MAG: methyltransferase domain-containing protein [Actinobacteria bacterium]|nr:methyltransferase domain-containing protein [Actinomycetota bacterium]MBU1942435.1 methyltransferase domain-containing protein [Actinomycetota bacterium]MBU2686307.1 methyltransferase domain-containing protein [Actinomycetota bacterium]